MFAKAPIVPPKVTTIYSLSLLIGLAVTSLAPPIASNGLHTTSNQRVSTDKPANHKTEVELFSNGTSDSTNHTADTEEAHTEEYEHGEAHIHVFTVDLTHVKYPFVFGLVVVIAGLSKIGFHHSGILSSKVPESCMLIVLGLFMGAIVFFCGVGEYIKFFKPHEFFLFLLPPIILEAAFSLHDRAFLENIGIILLFSVLGTVLACFLIGLTLMGLYQAGAMEDIGCSPVQILVFSSLIVAVDPVAVLAVFQEVGVNSVLYFIVFGESLLNDGVTVVLYNVMQTYNRMDNIGADEIILGLVKFVVVVVGALVIGVLLGLISSFLTKYTNSVKVVEPLVIFGFAYESYILAEMFHFSGIISIIGCGLTQVQYAFSNITSKSRLCVKFFAKVMSTTCEIIIFLFLGLETVNPGHDWKTGFTLWTLFFCIVYRFLIVYVISFLVNKCDHYRVRKIKLDEMFMISYGGLRGAVCFSLVALLDEREFPMKHMFVTTTLFVTFFTVFVQGGTIKYLVKWLRVTLAERNKEMNMYQELFQHVSDHLMAGIEEIVGHTGKFYLMEKMDHIDNQYFRPLLLKNPWTIGVSEIHQYYEKLMMREHRKNLQLCGVSNSKLPRVESGISINRMPRIESGVSLRTNESELNFRKMVHFDERAEHDTQAIKTILNNMELRESDIRELEDTLRDKGDRMRSKSQRTMGSGVDMRKLFRHALVSSSNRHSGNFHDKNFILDARGLYAGRLKRKHKLNARLKSMQSTVPKPRERALSWDPEEQEVCVKRTSEANLQRLDRKLGKAHTIDLSGTSESGVPPRGGHVHFHLSFEEIDEKSRPTEESPLMEKNGENVHVASRVKFAIDDKKEKN